MPASLHPQWSPRVGPVSRLIIAGLMSVPRTPTHVKEPTHGPTRNQSEVMRILDSILQRHLKKVNGNCPVSRLEAWIGPSGVLSGLLSKVPARRMREGATRDVGKRPALAGG